MAGNVFQIAQFRRSSSQYPFWMRMADMAPRLLLAVPCPTCGAASGRRCLLHSGRLRNEPHVDRKLCAIEAAEGKERPASEAGPPHDQTISR